MRRVTATERERHGRGFRGRAPSRACGHLLDNHKLVGHVFDFPGCGHGHRPMCNETTPQGCRATAAAAAAAESTTIERRWKQAADWPARSSQGWEPRPQKHAYSHSHPDSIARESLSQSLPQGEAKFAARCDIAPVATCSYDGQGLLGLQHCRQRGAHAWYRVVSSALILWGL